VISVKDEVIYGFTTVWDSAMLDIVDKITDGTKSWTFTGPSGPVVASATAPSFPSSVNFELEPDSSTFFRMPVVKRSFSTIKAEGIISMTPHLVISEEVKNFIGKIPCKDVLIVAPRLAVGSICYGYVGQVNMVTSWSQQGDFRYWASRTNIPRVTLNPLPDLTSAIRSTQSAAVAAFKSGYDLLTELAEGRETLAFFASTSKSASDLLSRFFSEVDEKALGRAIKGGYTPKKLLRHADKAMRNLGSKWMAYRYAIMPLFYSFQDIKKLIEERGLLFKTYRQREKLDLSHPGFPSGNIEPTLFTINLGGIEVRSTVKAGYSKEGLSSYFANQVAINPLATAYELVPLSFVFDWIVNMGDFIVSHTSLDFSEQSAMCTSIRENYTQETVILVDKYEVTSRDVGVQANLASRLLLICITISIVSQTALSVRSM